MFTKSAYFSFGNAQFVNMTIPNTTTAKLIGLAACGAAALGLSLDAALLTRTEDLLAALTAAGLLPSTAVATPATPAAQPTTPATQPEQPATTLPTGMGLTARVAWLEGQRTTNNKHNDQI